MSDTIADMLTRIRNAQRALQITVEMPHSKMKESMATIMKREGYLADVTVEGKIPKTLKLKLKYEGRKGVIDGLRRISTPGLRRYIAVDEIPRVRGGLGTAIISTSQGLMTGVQARKNKIGGELICYLW